ncbi:glutathione S-transferase C-terminal domain-containing protein [Altericista sp. CCNU0014]|uniref:glutathione S-transferase C-terminal domain-containing protein n=1 Tax=Altericista sp. CCNU0014 TaxID=3082949 RepID=UPI00384BDD5C
MLNQILTAQSGLFTNVLTCSRRAITELFENLDRWEAVLNQQRYLCGDRLTEADICMFATLYRFDSVYHGLFKCNLRRILDYPNLWNYLKDLYQRPAFKATCDLDCIKRGYYTSMTDINPNQIVPKGPIIDFDERHDRDARQWHRASLSATADTNNVRAEGGRLEGWDVRRF